MNRRHFIGGLSALPVAGGPAAQAQGVIGGLSALPAASGPTAQAQGLNAKIQQDRDAALEVLKPSRKELEHGLELHADSVVIESYGFSPRSAVDGDKLRAAMEAGASGIELDAMSEDMRMTGYVTDPAEQAEYKEAWEASGVTCILQNAGEEGQDPVRLLKRLAHYTYVTDMMSDFVSKAVRPDDIVEAKRGNKHCLYFTGNGVPLTQHWVSVEDELRYVTLFFQLGIRMMHVTYNRRNMLGDGVAEPANAGLSEFGRAAIAEMNRVGVIVDVAHCGWRTSLEAATASGKPMVASHTVAGALNSHIRSKPDEVIRAIADTGGYVGICCVPAFLGGKGDITTMLDHIDYVVKRFGAERAAIGTDVAYVSRRAGAENSKVPKRGPSRDSFDYFWPPDAFAGYPSRHRSMAWTNWPMFTVGLVQRGYSDADIRKIIGGNVLRVARAVLPASAAG
jgi:membrane dipeptidase